MMHSLETSVNSHGNWREGEKGDEPLSTASSVRLTCRGAVSSAFSLQTPLIMVLVVLAAF